MPTRDDLSLCQQDAVQALLERMAIAQRRSSRTKAIVLFGRDATVDGTYMDLKREVALTLTSIEGEYVDFEQHLSKLLESSGIAHDPLRLRATAVANYLYRLCQESKSQFLVVDKLNTTLRILLETSPKAPSAHHDLLRSLLQVMFPKPIVLTFPLFPEDARWLTQEAIAQTLGAESKWVHLEDTELDRTFLRERIAELSPSNNEGDTQWPK